MDDFIDLIPRKNYTFENDKYNLTSWNVQIESNRLNICAILSANLMLSKFGFGSTIKTITGYSMSLRTNLLPLPNDEKLPAKKMC